MTDMTATWSTTRMTVLGELGGSPADDVTVEAQARPRCSGSPSAGSCSIVLGRDPRAVAADQGSRASPTSIAGSNVRPTRRRREFWFGTDQHVARHVQRARSGARASRSPSASWRSPSACCRRLARHDRRLLPRLVGPRSSRSCFVVLLSFPALVLAILITSLLDRSLFTISVTLGILAIAPVGHRVAGHDDPVRRPRVRGRRAHARRQAPAHHRARAAAQRRDPDGRAGAARHGRGDRRRGRPGVPRALGREGHHVGQADPVRCRVAATSRTRRGSRSRRSSCCSSRSLSLNFCGDKAARPLRRQGDPHCDARRRSDGRSRHRAPRSVATHPDEPLLDVDDLKTHFRTERGLVRAVDGVIARRSSAASRSASSASPVRARPCSADRSWVCCPRPPSRRARCGSPARRSSASPDKQMRHLWGARDVDGVPEPDDLAQPA